MADSGVPWGGHMAKGSERGSPAVRADFRSRHPQWQRDACPALGRAQPPPLATPPLPDPSL